MSLTSTVEPGTNQAPSSQGSPIDRLFYAMTQLGASDLHLCVGSPALVRKDGRIQALANVHRLFVESRWTGAEMYKLVEDELGGYARIGEGQVQIDGPMVFLGPTVAQAVAVFLHELATNAAKYGGLSTPEGKVRVEWSRAADGRLVLHWTETGGPPVKPPTRRGFGTQVIESMVCDQLHGEMRLNWRAEGVECQIELPT